MGSSFRGVFACGAVALGLSGLVGCASPNYTYGRFHNPPPVGPAPASVVEHGEPHATLDRMTRVVESPSRLIPVGSKRPPRGLSPETADKLTAYLGKNDLADVPIYVNHYDPAGQWRRLRDNTEMSWCWKYSAGAGSVIAYTLAPGRVFGINRYNPYTNSLYVNSDQPIPLLHEAAVAKTVRSQRFPGAYAVLTSLPGLALVRQVRAANDVLSYTRAEKDWETERQAYRVLYPRVGTEGTALAMPLASFVSVMAWWARPILGLGCKALGGWVGGYVGDTVASRRAAEVHDTPPAAADASPAEATPPDPDSPPRRGERQ